MRYWKTIAVVTVALILVEAAHALTQKNVAKPEKAQHTIIVENAYTDHVKLTHICVYFFDKPWKGDCQKITNHHAVFIEHGHEHLANVERVALFGNNLKNPDMIAACLVFYAPYKHSVLNLKNTNNYLATVNFITGNDLVCSLSILPKNAKPWQNTDRQ